MLIDPDKMETSLLKIFALEFMTLGLTGVLFYYLSQRS